MAFLLAWSTVGPGWAAASVGAWALGTTGASVFVFMAMPDLHFLQSVCVLTFLLDVAYLVIFYRRIRPLRRPAAVA